jgi:hypothetical protein
VADLFALLTAGKVYSMTAVSVVRIQRTYFSSQLGVLPSLRARGPSLLQRESRSLLTESEAAEGTAKVGRTVSLFPGRVLDHVSSVYEEYIWAMP